MDDNGASSYRRLLKGDWDGMTEIVELYYNGLVLFLKRYLGNETLLAIQSLRKESA